MTAVLPHYKTGPANYQVAGLVYGGQFVVPNTLTAGTTDLTVAVAPGSIAAASGGVTNVLGVAGADANVISTQTGAANSYGEPAIDISVLGDYVPVYAGGWDIWAWYAGPAHRARTCWSSAPAPPAIRSPGCVTGISGTIYPVLQSTTITSFGRNTSSAAAPTPAACRARCSPSRSAAPGPLSTSSAASVSGSR